MVKRPEGWLVDYRLDPGGDDNRVVWEPHEVEDLLEQCRDDNTLSSVQITPLFAGRALSAEDWPNSHGEMRTHRMKVAYRQVVNNQVGTTLCDDKTEADEVARLTNGTVRTLYVKAEDVAL